MLASLGISLSSLCKRSMSTHSLQFHKVHTVLILEHINTIILKQTSIYYDPHRNKRIKCNRQLQFCHVKGRGNISTGTKIPHDKRIPYPSLSIISHIFMKLHLSNIYENRDRYKMFTLLNNFFFGTLQED